MKLIKSSALLMALLLTSSMLQAHSELLKVTPAEGAVMHMAPSVVGLEFSEAVQLLKFELALADGKVQAVGFKPSAEARKSFSVVLPALAPASYKVSWTVLGKDGHRVDGSAGFSINPEVEEFAGTVPAREHHGHK